jgi:hypothetical protein
MARDAITIQPTIKDWRVKRIIHFGAPRLPPESIKTMNTNKKSTKGSQKKNSKQDKNSSGTMKIVYVLMLVLMLSSSIIRIAGASRHNQSRSTPTPQVNPASSGWTAPRELVFHREQRIRHAQTW